MKLSLSRRLQLKENARNMENTGNDFSDEDMIQHSMDDEMGGKSGMSEDRGTQEKSDEELKEELRKNNLRNFPSMSNKGKIKENPEFNFIFENCTEIPKGNDRYKYLTSASAATLGRLWDDGILEYQGNIQRGYKLNSKNEEVPVFSSKHVKELLESALTQKLNGGVITLNILNTIPINFDPETRTIAIPPNQKLQILDGQHRLRCFSAWNRLYKRKAGSCINPEEFYMPILIEHASENTAKLIFSEYATKFLKISNSRSLFLDVDSNINKIARKLMSEVLNNKVEVVSNTIKKNSDKIVTFSVLNKAISALKPATPKECEVIGDFLCEYWSELIELFPKLMGDVHPDVRVSERTKSFAIEPMFIIAYHHLAKILLEDPNWKEKLKRLTIDDFLSRDNELWVKNITRNEGKLVNTSSTQSFVNQSIIDFVMQEK